MAMPLRAALEALAQHRGDRIVVPTMSSVPVWAELSNTPVDFFYVPSSMGQAPALGLGLALAHPERGVIVLNGDGCTLMNLGVLVTLASHPAPVFLVIIDNGMYEVTGGQPVAGSGRTDFAGLARAAGIPRIYTFDSLPAWQAGAAQALSGQGPVAIWLKIHGRTDGKAPVPPRPIGQQIKELKEALTPRT
jgi:thiamine pyrophosphate-dependent acetolactate synthase large subunit-like protein